MLRSEISAAALAMVGTPFHAQARMPGIGLDCIGVVVCLARAFDLPHADVAAYPMRPNGMLMPLLDAQLVRVHREPQEGDVLLMSFADTARRPAESAEPHHVAVMVGGGRIVHAYATVSECVVQSYTDHWRAKVRAIYQFPGVE